MVRLLAMLALLMSLSCISAAQTAPPRVRVSSGVAAGLLKTRVSPVYPPLARQARIQGTVMLSVTVDQDGNVQDISLISGHPMLAPAAIEAVKQWKYRPYLLNGIPVNLETQVQVNFSLSENPSPDQPSAEGAGSNTPGVVTGTVVTGKPSPLAGDDPRIATPQRIRVSSGVSQQLVVKKVPPQYPQDAREQNIQGAVILQATIDKEGNVSKLELISGHPLLAPAAIEAVKQWKYKPYMLAGNSLEVETQIQVNFSLKP